MSFCAVKFASIIKHFSQRCCNPRNLALPNSAWQSKPNGSATASPIAGFHNAGLLAQWASIPPPLASCSEDGAK